MGRRILSKDISYKTTGQVSEIIGYTPAGVIKLADKLFGADNVSRRGKRDRSFTEEQVNEMKEYAKHKWSPNEAMEAIRRYRKNRLKRRECEDLIRRIALLEKNVEIYKKAGRDKDAVNLEVEIARLKLYGKSLGLYV